MTPELRHLQVSLGAQISYRKAADLLRLLLPPMGGTTHTTTGRFDLDMNTRLALL